MRIACLIMIGLAVASAATAQNPVSNGDFESGLTGWTNVRFNDPLGKHGVRVASVLDGKPSSALYADFQTLSPVMECRYDSDPFRAEAKGYPLSFDCLWEKQVTTPIPSVTVNYVQLLFRDSTTSAVFVSFTVQVPGNQTTLYERVSYKNTVTFPQAGNYQVQIFMRHSNLAGMPYIAHIDNLVVGTAGGLLYGGGAPSPGKNVDLVLSSPGDAGLSYVLGSSLGTGPIPLGTRVLNLSPDDLLVATVFQYLPAIFVDYQKPLDAQGQGQAQIRIPANPVLLGMRIHTAYVVLQASAPFGIKTISNTFTFTIL
ncbi:MAG: hypothetical protein JXQ29_16710 [Planctomycetes bacterium]|nr:hypothetical protein [Planctomycetota bacterium]